MTKKNDQLKQFDKAYQNFIGIVNSLTPTDFLQSIGGWTPRDIVAHLIGWNRNILTGCRQIRVGVVPFYHSDALYDYRALNAEFIARYKSTDRHVVLKELEEGKDELLAFLNKVDELEWDKDFGVQHYRGGTATISRSVESLMRDYLDHAEEIRNHQTLT